MKRRIICTNQDGMEVVFGSSFSPFLLEDCDGLYTVTNNVVSSENTMTDGATYQGSTTKVRNIILTLRDKPDSNHQKNRTLLYNLFKPKAAGVLTYIEDETSEGRTIEYYVEKIDIDSTMRARRATVSLLCPDPFFVASSDISVTIAGWVPSFEFPHEFLQNGEEIGIRVDELLKTIENTSAADNIGITITISATGPITNPSVYHIEEQEYITIGTENQPFNMVSGDELIITTGINNKHVYYFQNGVKTEINEYLTEDSEFIQLMHGINTIGYSALVGEQNMTVMITYRYRYLGV